MKAPKSVGKSVRWAIRFLGDDDVMTARHDGVRVKRNPGYQSKSTP